VIRLLACVACLLLLALPVHAQQALGLATQVESDGFRVGERAVAHVFGNVDVRYDSNPSIRNDAPGSDLLLRFRAGGSIARPSDRLQLKLGLSFDYTQFLGVTNPATRRLSAPQGQLDFGMLANKTGRFTFFFNDTLTRVDSAANISLTERMRWTRNFAQIGSDIRPAGGRALEFRVTYGLDFILYDPDQQSVQEPLGLSFMTHVANLTTLWRFFPKTALVADVQGAFTIYPFPAVNPNPNVNALRAQAGMVGQITEKLTVVAKAGYGNSFIFAVPGAFVTPNFSSAIATATATFRPSDHMRLSGGYTRDFTPTPIFGWMSIDRAFAEFRWLIGARFIADLKAQYMFQNFGLSMIPGVGPRSDHVITGEARFGVQGKAWFGGSVYYMPELRYSSFVSPNATPAQYQRHVVGVDVSFGW
jgi:hypothetical protein